LEGSFTPLDSTSNSDYDDTSAIVGLTYWYRVVAVYPNGTSLETNTAVATPFSNFAEPQNLVAVTGQSGAVPLMWSVPLVGVPSGYEVWRSETGEFGTYEFLVQTTFALHTDLDVVNGFEYWYRVLALYIGPNGESGFSNSRKRSARAYSLSARRLESAFWRGSSRSL
jgi:hypothetical protein